MRFLILFALIAAVASFSVRPFARAPIKTQLKMSSYWEGKAPPSSVLGVGEKLPSALLGPLSLAALGAGTYAIHESNIFNALSATSVNPVYVVGSLLVPISWGLHVAAWIQKENKK
eukprot:gene14208-19062_t